MKKKVVALTLALTLAAGLVTGCGNAKKDDNKADSKTITVAASQTPHSEILAEAAKTLKKQGYDLKVTVFDDYVQPNNVVESGEFDANYVEHKPYMEQFNKENGTLMPAIFTMSHLEFTVELRQSSKMLQRVIPLQFQTIQQTKREHYYFCRIMVY